MTHYKDAQTKGKKTEEKCPVYNIYGFCNVIIRGCNS